MKLCKKTTTTTCPVSTTVAIFTTSVKSCWVQYTVYHVVYTCTLHEAITSKLQRSAHWWKGISRAGKEVAYLIEVIHVHVAVTIEWDGPTSVML